MRAISHIRHGDPADVLSVTTRSDPSVRAGQVLVRTSLVPIHQGDLHATAASPAFGAPLPIPDGGRVPGLEGVGVVESLSGEIEARIGFGAGTRVIFFPVPGTWQDRIVADPTALVPVPDDIADDVAANLVIDAVTACLVVRDGLAGTPDGEQQESAVILTGAGSAVGRIATLLLRDRGVPTLRLVRSRQGAEALRKRLPGSPVVATDAGDWMDEARAALGDRKAFVALDAVGGRLLPNLAALVEIGGTISNFGSLGGAETDIRLLVPRRLTLRGVSITAWFGADEAQRRDDVDTALRLARAHPDQFGGATIFKPEAVKEAVGEVGRQGKSGAVLLDFH